MLFIQDICTPAMLAWFKHKNFEFIICNLSREHKTEINLQFYVNNLIFKEFSLAIINNSRNFHCDLLAEPFLLLLVHMTVALKI